MEKHEAKMWRVIASTFIVMFFVMIVACTLSCQYKQTIGFKSGIAYQNKAEYGYSKITM